MGCGVCMFVDCGGTSGKRPCEAGNIRISVMAGLKVQGFIQNSFSVISSVSSAQITTAEGTTELVDEYILGSVNVLIVGLGQGCIGHATTRIEVIADRFRASEAHTLSAVKNSGTHKEQRRECQVHQEVFIEPAFAESFQLAWYLRLSSSSRLRSKDLQAILVQVQHSEGLFCTDTGQNALYHCCLKERPSGSTLSRLSILSSVP